MLNMPGRLIGRSVVAAVTAGAVSAMMAVSASAAPHKVKPHPPVHGAKVSAPCANPANHGNKGKVHGPAKSTRKKVVCFSKLIADKKHKNQGPLVMGGPTGYGPSQIQSAYKLSGLNANGRTVAIVDAYADPKAEADLAKFRSTYGLPACTTANGCFKQENQNGASSPLAGNDYGWALEESLDLDMVSAACPTCHILYVGANSANDADMIAAEKTALNSGAVSVSNSWGENESGDAQIPTYDPVFNHPGVAISAGSGDSGYVSPGAFWPASNPHVTAVGGTSLTSASNARGWSESAWSGAGSGCSGVEPKPSWQTDTGCSNRTVADVSAMADPNTGMGVYDTDSSCGSNVVCDLLIELGLAQGMDGWAQVGGTSMATPLIASVYALAGNTSQISDGSYPYSHTSSLFDVTSGSNGGCGTYICNAGPGYDGPTGLGTPDGTGGF